MPSRQSNDITLKDAKRIIEVNHEIIIENQIRIDYLKRKAQLEDQLTASFIKNLLKEKNRPINDNLNRTLSKNNSFLQLPNGPSLSRYESSILESRESRIYNSIISDRSPIGSISKRDL